MASDLLGSSSANTKTNMFVTLNISELVGSEVIPERIITLGEPDWSIHIGRGSSTEPGLNPSPKNGWFTSRVISRHHAVIRANPRTKEVTVEDIGSMHGTTLDGEPLLKGKPIVLAQDDILVFGTEVVRGSETYQPLQISVAFEWGDSFEQHGQASDKSRFVSKTGLDGAFYELDDDYLSEESKDIEFVRESVRQPSLEIISRPRTFTVPDDDDDDDDDNVSSSVSSEDSYEPYLSSPSDPPEADDINTDDGKQLDQEVAADNNSLESNNELEHETDFSNDYGNEKFRAECSSYRQESDDAGAKHFIPPAEGEVQSPSKSLLGSNILCQDSIPFQSLPPIGYDAQNGQQARESSPSDAALAKPTVQRTTRFDVLPTNHIDSFVPFAQGSRDHLYSYLEPSNTWQSLPQNTYNMDDSCLTKPQPYNSWQPIPAPGSSANPFLAPPNFEEQQTDGHNVMFSDSTMTLCHYSPEQEAPKKPLKRKAKDISEGADTFYVLSGPIDAAVPVKAVSTTELSKTSEEAHRASGGEPKNATVGETERNINKLTKNELDGLEEMEFEVLQSEERAKPPRKKLKKTMPKPEPSKSRAARYAATAMAGAMIGVVGTICGLAFLPEDFI